MFTRLIFGVAVLFGLALAVSTVSAVAKKERKERRGLAERLHRVHNVGRKVCMKRHRHYGSSIWNGSKKVSKKEAINSWVVFTKIEYGAAWANFKMAEKHKVVCDQNAYRQWRCDAEGYPCRKR